MNLIYHLDDANETVPSDIAKRVVSNAMAPVITVTSTVLLDRHIEETYGIDSLYMLLRFLVVVSLIGIKQMKLNWGQMV